MPVTAEPVTLNCKLNQINVSFQLDSGASISTISHKDATKIKACVKPSSRHVHAYNGESVQLLGESNILVTYNNLSFTHKFFVVSNNKVNLFGRDLCQKFNIKVVLPDTVNFTNDIQSEFKDYLSDDFKSNVKQTVHLDVVDDAKPIFSRPRQVPVKLREKLHDELQRLVEEGKLTKIHSSKWASPVVTVFKNNGSLRLCGDYSATVNKFLDPVQTPLPTVDDTISRIGKASLFSKLDLSQAFLQLPLDDVSKKCTVINTPVDLFQYNYLPFVFTASPGIFQAFLNETLSHDDDLIIYQDDVLILTKNYASHLHALRSVLSAFREKGI